MSCLNPNLPIYKEILRITESPAQTEIILKYKSSDEEYGMIPFSVAKPIYKYYNLVSEDNKPKKLSFKDANDWVKKTKDSLYFNFKVSKTETKDYQILLYLKPEEEDLYLKPGEGIQGTLFQNTSPEGQLASEQTIRELAARMSDRIGMPIRFESDRTKQYKGKIENGVAYINLAYATLDTPIHEILGHPIIRAIKNKTIASYINKKYITEEEFFEKIKGKDSFSDYEWRIGDNIYKVENYNDDNVANHKYTVSQLETNQLYQNLLKELETGKGKEVLDRIKRDYNVKKDFIIGFNNIVKKDGNFVLENNKGEVLKLKDNTSSVDRIFLSEDEVNQYLEANKYTLEEQQEEAIVELLGLMTAEKLDNVKDGKLISLLKRLLKEMKAFIRQLLNQKEVEIDKLPDNMTLGDISDLLAYSNSKLILPGYEVEYTTPDNMKFKTYQEASNHISELAKSVEDVDLNNVSLDIDKNNNPYNLVPDKPYYTSDSNFLVFVSSDKIKHYKDFPEYKNLEKENYYEYKFIPSKYTYEFVKVTTARVQQLVDNNPGLYIGASDELKNADLDKIGIKNFIEKNKEYEQSKEIIEEWKKVNNIQYNPDEIYSRGQEFSSVVGAYSDFDVNLMMQNLLQHIEDNEKAGGKFAISAYTKPIDRVIGHLEGGGGKIKFKIYPKSENILWASNIDVYSGSVWDASLKVNKDKKSELLGVSYTKYPSLQDVNTVQPNLANIVDNLAHHHNELGIVLTGNNFRLEYDEDIPYQTKKIIDSINKILDQKYGKVVKPEINNLFKYGSEPLKVGTEVIYNGRRLVITKIYEDGIYKKYDLNGGLEKGLIANQFKQVLINPTGIQPTQTNETLKESIDSVKSKVVKYNEGDLTDKSEFTEILEKEYNEAVQKGKKGFDLGTSSFGYTETYDYNGYIYTQIDYNEETGIDTYGKIKKESKEYTSQALINTKIAALKEVAKKYPRSLIRSEVKPTNSQFYKNLGFEEGEMPFQKVPEEQSEENKSELETFLEEIEQYPTEELSPIVGEYYDILSRHLNDLVNNKNYTKLKELFTEDKVNKVEKIQDIVRRANKLKDTISKQKQQALALAKTVIQLDYLIDKVEVKIEDIIKNEQDALLNLEELQRYLDMINNWNQLLKVAAEKFPKTKVEEKVILTQNKIKRIKKNIILNDKSGIVSMLKEVLGDYSMKYNINAQEELQKLKTILENKIKNKRSPEDIEKARKKVELKQQEIDALDFEVGNNILDFLEGKRGDVNAFFTSIRAYRDSSNPTIFGFATYMRDLIDNNINKAYNWGIAYERELDLTQLDRLNPSIMGKAITFVDKSGDLMLLNKWKDYKFDLNALRDIEKAALVDFNSSNTDEKEEIYLKARKDRTDFEKDYMYREFTDAYYEKFELFEDPIGKSLKEDIDFIFNQIKDIDAKVGDMQPTQEELDIKAALLRSYNQLGSIYAKNKKKEGDALLKAERMRQYRKINSKIYDYIPDYNLFEEAKEKFKDYLVTDLELSETSPEYAQELLKWTQANTRTVISQKYYEDVENLMLKLKVLFDRSQNKEIKEDIVKQWEIIKDAIYSNKDEDNQPIGSIIDPFPSEKIKSAQETIESLIQLGRELGNLTPNQLQRLKELEDLQEVSELSESENIELRELNSLHSMSSASDRARLKVLLQELSELQSKVPTTYYIDEFNSFSAALGIIIDDNGNVDWDAFSEEENIPQGVSILNSPKLDELLEDPEFNDWFNKNHIKVKKFNKETFEYEIVWQRTFQWSVNKPNDAKYYEILPSQAYTNREVKPEFKTGYNKNTKQVELVVGEHITNLSKYDFLPDPNKIKSAEYANQKYYDLKNAKDSTSKRYFKNLEIHTERALQAQENAMYTAKIWLNVPAALKTSQENLVGSIKSVKNPSTIAKNVKNRVKSIKEGINNFSEDPDINFKSPLEKEEEEKNKRYKNSYAQDFFKIPIKFTAAKEADLISLDLQRSYSLYNESVSRNKLLLEKLPIAKSLKRLLEDTNEDNTKDSVKNTLTAVLDIIMREFEGSTSYRDIENNKSVISGVKVLKTLAGAALIKFNIMAAKVNLLTATFQNFIFSNNQLYNSVGYYKSLYTYKKIFIPGILADKIGNRIGKRSLASQMFVLWQPVMGMNIEDYIGDKTGNSTGINLVEHYNPVKLLRDLSEGLVQSRPWVAALRTAKVERTLPDGSKDIIDLWDIYELDADGFLTVKEGVDKQWLSGGKLFNKKKSEIQQFIRHRQGNYDPRDKTKYETSFFSSIPFFLKKFYISTGSALFYASLPNDAPWTDYFRLKGGDTLGGEPRGMLYQTVQVGHFIITNNIRNWSTLTMQDKKAVQKTALFITSLVILDLLIKMYFGYRGDDKNKKENLEKYSWWEFQMIIMLIKVRQQLDTFTSVIAGYDTISSNSLFIGLKKWIDVWEAALPYYDIDEKEIKMDTRKATKRNIKGELIYEKGDLILPDKILNAFGIESIENYYKNPDQTLKGMSSQQQ